MADSTPPGYIEEDRMDMDNSVLESTRGDIYHRLDPLDARKVSLDIFEMYCHEMIHTPTVGRRAYLIEKMKYIMVRLIGNQYPYGRLYNRTCIANITARVCARHAYPVDDASDADDGYNYRLQDYLVDFSPEKWKKIIAQFEALRESFLRNDASLLVLPEELTDGDGESGSESEVPVEDDGENQSLASLDEFTNKYDKILHAMKFHMCLSHTALQKVLVSGHAGNSLDEEAAVIPLDDILAFDNEIEEAFGGDGTNEHSAILRSLLLSNKRTKRSSRLQLKSFDEIKKIYESNESLFDLSRFQHSFLRLIRRWSELVLPVGDLVKLGYGSSAPPAMSNKENISSLGSAVATKPSQRHKRTFDKTEADEEFQEEEEEESDHGIEDEIEENEGNLGRLKRKREELMKNVKDPLYQCAEKAKSARTFAESESSVSTPKFRRKKKKTYKIAFSSGSEGEDSDGSECVRGKSVKEKVEVGDLEDSEEEDDGVKLSKVPKKFKPKVDVAPKAITISNTTKAKQGKRKRFTDSEDAAIRNGVERFGPGRWADIKSYYHIELADRSAVQIKDRWRTLNK